MKLRLSLLLPIIAALLITSCKKSSNPESKPEQEYPVQIAAGYEHTLLLRSDGKVWASGFNSYGQIGSGALSSTTNSKFVNIASDAVKISAGTHTTFIIKSDKTLWGCGNNIQGQLGLGAAREVLALTKLADNVKDATGNYEHTLILKTDNTLWGSGTSTKGMLGDAVILP